MAPKVAPSENPFEAQAAGSSPLVASLMRHPYFCRALTELDGIGDKRAELFANLGIATVADLVMHFPRTYQDRSRFTSISDVQEGQTVTLQAEVVKAKAVRLKRRLTLAEVTLRDATGTLKAIWFGQDYLVRVMTPGVTCIFHGPVSKWNGLALRNPDYELLVKDEDERIHTGRVVPIYRLTDGLSQRIVRRTVWAVLELLPDDVPDGLPPVLKERYGWQDTRAALRCVHFPDDLESVAHSRNRFAYEELLYLQIGIQRSRLQRLHEETGFRHVVNGRHLESFRRALPFALTASQQRVVGEILNDMASPRSMIRLVQGDVGCGKTIVALHAVAAAVDGGYQAALMAPTEILAEQHAYVLRSHLEPLGLDLALLTGSTQGAAPLRKQIASGACSVVVGTHALFQEATGFKRLGLVIIDEQHRFGVLQRSALVEKGLNPDILHMTATPIPRTLAITVYGGMDLSIIDELPPGRKPVTTRRIPDGKVNECYDYICRQAGRGLQTYIVCPLVDESDKKALTSVTKHYDVLSNGPLASVRTGLLHGRLSYDEKDAVMRQFKDGAIDVLFSTTVIEVGVDCPNATTMVIEDAAQFGLTQLHQLRGRVGRGEEQAYCFLLGKPRTPEGKQRLDLLVEHASGFDIAEADLLMRGPGEFLGVRQAGLSDLRVADLIRDVHLIDAARRDAGEWIAMGQG